MNTSEESTRIKLQFRSGLTGIIQNSAGLKKLLLTKYNFAAGIISVIVWLLYFWQIQTAEESLRLIENLNDDIVSLLSGMVGLSLAALTMIMTFTNPEIIESGAFKQFQIFKETKIMNASYYQVVIAKFSFVLFFQVVSLLFFMISAIIENMSITVEQKMAYWTNSGVFMISVYLIVFSIILIIALILNLFTFSQTSNFVRFMSNFSSSDDLDKSEDV